MSILFILLYNINNNYLHFCSLVSIVTIKITKTSSHCHNNIFNLDNITKYYNILEYIFLIIKKIY